MQALAAVQTSAEISLLGKIATELWTGTSEWPDLQITWDLLQELVSDRIAIEITIEFNRLTSGYGMRVWLN
jgi:hypothetical protein